MVDRLLFYIDDNTRVARDRLNFITQYRTKNKKTGEYTDNWKNDRYFHSFKQLLNKVALIDVRQSDASDVKSLTMAINDLMDKIDGVKDVFVSEVKEKK